MMPPIPMFLLLQIRSGQLWIRSTPNVNDRELTLFLLLPFYHIAFIVANLCACLYKQSTFLFHLVYNVDRVWRCQWIRI